MDQFEGDENDALSLHKYTYAKVNPVGLLDPTGFYSQSDGYDAEREIFAIYQQDHPGDNSSSGGWARLGGGYRLKPDILNPTIQTFLEIKPITLSGIYSGTLQLALYSAAFAPSGYFPEFGWVPPETTFESMGAPLYLLTRAV
jgi:hypothetical protein